MKKEYSRREFLQLTGKGLSALAFVGASVKFGLPKAHAADSKKSVNALVSGENEMRVVFLQRVDENKSDAFYILNTTPGGLEIILMDSGKGNKRCRDELLRLRSEILTHAGLETEIANSDYVLNITAVLSHFHSDHVDDLFENIVPFTHRFRLNGLYFPAATRLIRDGTYSNDGNADIMKRYKALYNANVFHRKYCPQHELPFGETLDVPSTLGSIRLYASPVDWGDDEHVKWMENYHFAAKPHLITNGMGTEVLNGNCLWMRVEYAGHSVLFTGDTNKKFEDRSDEALDLFIDAYGEALRSDIVKFPHHGRGRDAACAPLRAHLMTDDPMAECILSGVDGPELAGKVLDTLSVRWDELNTHDVVYVIREGGMEKIVRG